MTTAAGARPVAAGSSILRRRKNSLMGAPLRIDMFEVDAGCVPAAAPEYCVDIPENGWLRFVSFL